MKTTINLLSKTIAAIALTLPLNVFAVDENGNYFTNDFEDNIPMTEGETTGGMAINVEGEGEWLFKLAFVSTNTSYVVSGTQNLRLKKNGSYVITPVLNKGVKDISFNCKRKGKGIDVYTSVDAGATWTKVSTVSSTGVATIAVNDTQVNRVKIANDGGGDADIDDLTISATAFGVEAQVSTGDATNITKNQADLSGSIIDRGDQPTKEMGIVWATHAEPTVGDSKEEAESVKETSFTLTIGGLKAQTTYHYRAYAVSNAGTVYGEDKTFTTADATPAVITTSEVMKNGKKYVADGNLTDDGGADVLELGMVYGETEGVTLENGQKVAAKSTKPTFRIELPLTEGKTYYYRAYAITSVGTSLSDEHSVTIDNNVPDAPDLTEKIWCAPDGDDATGDGTAEHPFYSLDKAIALVEPGQRICMKAGRYIYDHRINIDNKNGTEDEPIELYGVDGHAILDFSAMPHHSHSNNPLQGVRLTSSYWHFYHIDICNASDNGLLIERNKPTGGSNTDIMNATDQAHHNLIEECNFYKNGDTGLQMKNLASFNRVVNCDSYLNCDEDQGDADGFAPKISVGDGNYFYGCRAWAHSDDGWDVFFKKDGGFPDNVTIIMENCIAYKNGFLDLNTIAPSGNGNGFKCGSDQGAMNVYMNRCLAIHNKAKGFDQNHNAGDIILNNCTGMTSKALCGDKTYSYRIYEEIASGHEVRLTNCIAINDNDATDKRDKQGNVKDSEHGKYGQYGRFEVDASLDRLSIVNCEFQKADPTQFISIVNDEELIGERQEDGSLPETTFAHLVDGSPLIDAGVKIDATTYRGIQVSGIEYADEAPDLGAYEKGTIVSGIEGVEWADENISVQQTESGLTLLTVGGQTTAVRLPNSRGRIVIMQVMKDGKPVGHVKMLMK